MESNRQFEILARDTDTPMVRRAVASNVGNFAGVVEGHLLLSDVVPVFEALASDDQDNVRLLAVEQAGKVAKALTDQVSSQLLRGIYECLFYDYLLDRARPCVPPFLPCFTKMQDNKYYKATSAYDIDVDAQRPLRFVILGEIKGIPRSDHATCANGCMVIDDLHLTFLRSFLCRPWTSHAFLIMLVSIHGDRLYWKWGL